MKSKKVMEIMAKLVNHLVERESKENGPESMKPRTINLPILPEPSNTAPINLAVWLTVIEPTMTDSSDSSTEW